MSALPTLAMTALVLAACLGLLWLLSLRLADTSIVDIFWGSGFVVVAWVAHLHGGAGTWRGALALALVTVWGLRLTLYLALRNHGRGEDPRYAAMRRQHGAAWGARSLVLVFGLQGCLLWVVSLPVQAVVLAGSAGAPSALDALAVGLWTVGLAFETVGDWQLWAFKANPANKGRLLDTGLWRYTRHPNYFGDFLAWWGLYVLAVAAGAAWTVVSPVLMSVLLIRVSGAALTEKVMSGRPGFDDYLRRTSAFFPWPPRG